MKDPVMTDTHVPFKARDIGLRAQKKILSRMATKTVAKTFIDDSTASLLDNIYRLAKLHLGNKREAEKVVKNMIKTVIKIGILYRNDQLNEEELQLAERFRQKFQTLQLAIISFYEVDFSFDLHYLQKVLFDSRTLLKGFVTRHLTEKSVTRIDDVFDFFSDNRLLETAFKKNSAYQEVMGNLVADMNRSLDTENRTSAHHNDNINGTR